MTPDSAKTLSSGLSRKGNDRNSTGQCRSSPRGLIDGASRSRLVPEPGSRARNHLSTHQSTATSIIPTPRGKRLVSDRSTTDGRSPSGRCLQRHTASFFSSSVPPLPAPRAAAAVGAQSCACFDGPTRSCTPARLMNSCSAGSAEPELSSSGGGLLRVSEPPGRRPSDYPGEPIGPACGIASHAMPDFPKKEKAGSGKNRQAGAPCVYWLACRRKMAVALWPIRRVFFSLMWQWAQSTFAFRRF
jgi:hypothetical protein